MAETTIGQLGFGLAFLVQFGALIWWASQISSSQKSLIDIVREIKLDVKEHIEEDREFQLSVVKQLSGVRPTSRRNGSHEQN